MGTHTVPLREQLVRDRRAPAWLYVGPLDDGKDIIRDECTNVSERDEGKTYVIGSTHRHTGIPTHTSTRADTREEAWRAHIGAYLGDSQPFPDDAHPGETLAQFKARATHAQLRRALD